ncbi:hypothetical protein RclHR1_16170005 [Rhizophagus clarus]|uniref:Transposase Tc1-like domain-containing protein n=1 Tax=Rhizophagus clarus TaxID=94130 RepID=A0A2Z6QH18_9GLOM|nr:hypothetical protein RclHR1_16170005 [Rhizophagus clarus]
MLTAVHKQKRIRWAQKHLNDNWNQTLFSDETAFQLFQNTVQCWYKGVRPIRSMPKDRQKFLHGADFVKKAKQVCSASVKL